MVDALENEDAFYQFENYSLKKQRGYYIYYEINQEMKNYMLAEGEMGRMPERNQHSDTIKRDTAVVKNYKKMLKKKKQSHKKTFFQKPGYIIGGIASVCLFAYGVHAIVQFQNTQNTQAVFRQQSVMDEATTEIMEKSTVQSSASQEKTAESTTQQVTEEPTTQQVTEESTETWNSIGGYYTVKRGDTLAGISKKMYQSYNYIETIAQANGIENVDEIYPGQILEIPQIED